MYYVAVSVSIEPPTNKHRRKNYLKMTGCTYVCLCMWMKKIAAIITFEILQQIFAYSDTNIFPTYMKSLILLFLLGQRMSIGRFEVSTINKTCSKNNKLENIQMRLVMIILFIIGQSDQSKLSVQAADTGSLRSSTTNNPDNGFV